MHQPPRTEKERLENLPPRAKFILNIGTLLGISAGCVVLVFGPFRGMIAGTLCGMIGAIAGFAIAKPIALAVAQREENQDSSSTENQR